MVVRFFFTIIRARTRVDKQTTTHKKMCTQEKFLPGDVFVSEKKKKPSFFHEIDCFSWGNRIES